MGILKYIQRLFCDHGLMKVIHSEYYADDDLSIVKTDTYKCEYCDKVKKSVTVTPMGNEISEVEFDLYRN